MWGDEQDIPLTFGPWKLHGLPGLILKGEDSDGFIFTAIGLQTTDKALTDCHFGKSLGSIRH